MIETRIPKVNSKKPDLSLPRAAVNSAHVRAVPPIISDVLHSPGQLLDESTGAFLEPRFGHDFSWIPTHHPVVGVIQTKLAINKPGDEFEQEADRIADQVLAASAHATVSGALPRIQRFAGQPARQADPAPASVDRVLAGSGRPLDTTLQQDMGQRFGHDFSRVRVHSGGAAEQSAREVNAHAYTVGHNIVFGAGQFAPRTNTGRRLLAHELTHVVQQSGGAGMRAGQSDERRGRNMSISAQPTNIIARQSSPSADAEAPQSVKGADAAPPDSAPKQTQTQATDPQLPTCTMQAVDQWIPDPQNSSKQLFGLTTLSGAGRTQPEFILGPAPGGGKGFVVLPTSASLAPIQSKFLKPGRYVDRRMINFRPQEGSGFPYRSDGYPNVWEVTSAGSAKIQAGEQEHCDDFRLAFYLSLYRFVEIVNDMAAKGTVYPSKAAADSALRTQVAIDPAKLFDYFKCLASWMQNERDTKPWHTPTLPHVDSVSYDSNVRDQVAIRTLTENALPEVGKHSSWDLLQNGAAQACVQHTTLKPTTSTSPATNPQPRGNKRLQRKALGAASASRVPAIVQEVLSTPGKPLDAQVRGLMEPRLGWDFSHVRVHTDACAAASADAVQAHAFTVGNHVVFGAEQYTPQLPNGLRLLAHELTHVIQQSGARVDLQALSMDEGPESPAEREAERVAVHVDTPMKIGRSLGQGIARVQRQDKPTAVNTPSLTYTAQAPVQGQCGDFRWQIKWQLNGATEQTNGFIVQKVKQVSLSQKCDDSPDDVFNIYWEAWQVKNGKIMSGLSERESLGDEFVWSNTNGSKGSTYVAGSAKFMAGYNEPFKWGHLKEAGPLPATTSQPAGWTESGSKYRFVGIPDYFCCEGQHRSSKLNTEELDV